MATADRGAAVRLVEQGNAAAAVIALLVGIYVAAAAAVSRPSAGWVTLLSMLPSLQPGKVTNARRLRTVRPCPAAGRVVIIKDDARVMSAANGRARNRCQAHRAELAPTGSSTEEVMGAFFRLIAAGPLFFVSAWILMIFAGIVDTDVGIRPFGYVTSMVVTIALWLTLAPAIGAVARPPGKTRPQKGQQSASDRWEAR